MKTFPLATLLFAIGAQTAVPPAPVVPLEPVAAMVDALRTHSVVAVTAGHGDSRGYAFGQLLIHDPRLIAAINDIASIATARMPFQETVTVFGCVTLGMPGSPSRAGTVESASLGSGSLLMACLLGCG